MNDQPSQVQGESPRARGSHLFAVGAGSRLPGVRAADSAPNSLG
jgi:hypothetical protein